MRVLIAFDGSRDAESALDDLRACGLAHAGEAKVISIAEVWLPPKDALNEKVSAADAYLEKVLADARTRSDRAVSEAEMMARYAANRVRVLLPEWEVSAIASSGSPAWEIVDEAKKFDADLIVVGAQGNSLFSRIALGSISQKVLTEARCSVRIGRGSIDIDPGPQRIVVGFDGSKGAIAAVRSVSDRTWSSGTEIRLVSAAEPSVPPAISRFVNPAGRATIGIRSSDRVWFENSAETALASLAEAGLDARLTVRDGNPKHVLVEEAETWGADCIFVGANARGGLLERFVVGSTSAAVAARAHCSVEVVRNSGSSGNGRPNQKSA